MGPIHRLRKMPALACCRPQQRSNDLHWARASCGSVRFHDLAGGFSRNAGRHKASDRWGEFGTLYEPEACDRRGLSVGEEKPNKIAMRSERAKH